MAIAERLRRLFGQPQEISITFTPEEAPLIEGLTARQLYATQANLHAVVSFLADSVAQLPLKVYKREGETDRRRDRDSLAARLLYKPNSDQTCYELIDSLVTELLLMGNVFLWVLPDPASDLNKQLRLIPNEWLIKTEKSTNYAPDAIVIKTKSNAEPVIIPRSDFVQFRLYSPGNPGGFQSPISALKQTLMEQVTADKFRTQVWRSSGRFNAYITRPKDVQPWDEGARTKFIEAFREAWGVGGANAGKMPLLEDGMEIKPYQFNAQQAQYVETKQLSREDVAAAFHVNPALIWRTSTQTYASAKDNARSLYADCLGPTLQMLQQRINSFLLPLLDADPDLYVEFDLTEKLKGSFEERASIMQAAVGGPWITRDEARADNNLPPLPDGQGARIITPLNISTGDERAAEPVGLSDEPAEGPSENAQASVEKKAAEMVRIKAKSDESENKKMSDALRKFFKRQEASVLPKLGSKSESWWDEDRWNEELTDDLEPIIDSISSAHGGEVAAMYGFQFDRAQTKAYLRKVTISQAEAINRETHRRLKEALADADKEDGLKPADVFKYRVDVDSDLMGSHLALVIAGWAAISEAPEQAQQRGITDKIAFKQWMTGPNPRPSHALMNGEMVPISDNFSNGAKWPGDFDLPPEQTCNCNCSTDIVIEKIGG